MTLIRADILMTRSGKVSSRSQALDLIRRGLVLINGKPISKGGTLVPADGNVTLTRHAKFVSRGGDKLEGALEDFGIPVKGMTVLDCGASTGGFVDCLLQNGAEKVYAVDVGYGQLHWKLRQDPRVVVMERTNIRYLTPNNLAGPVDLVTLDVSFISLRLVLEPVSRILKVGGGVLALVKPQFEAGKSQVGAKGVVRDKKVHVSVLKEITTFASKTGWTVLGITNSPLRGPQGNREFFLFLTRGKPIDENIIDQWIQEVVADSESE